MREILFRGKRVDNGEWVEGLIARIGEMGISNIVEKQFDILVPVKTETVGQYTGLTDKNGKKIFENDIMTDNYTDRNVKIIFKCGEFFGDGGTYGKIINSLSINDEVIGNIFDNSELLEANQC